MKLPGTRRGMAVRPAFMSATSARKTPCYSRARQHKAQADVDPYFSPPVEQFGMLERKQFHRIVEASYRHGMEQLELADKSRLARFGHG